MIRPSYAILAATSWLLLVAGAVAWTTTLPATSAVEPTAFQPGASNMSALLKDLQGTGFDTRVIVSEPMLFGDDAPSRTLLLIPAPSKTMLPSFAATIDAHLVGGGSVWIADGNGLFNDWLATHGASITRKRIVASDPDQNFVPLETSNLTGLTAPVGALEPGRIYLEDETAWKIVLQSSTGHLDIDGNGTVDRADTPGPHPVMAMRSVGAGRLFVSADDSMLRDESFESSPSNGQFVRAILALALPSGGTVVIDESSRGLMASEPYTVPVITLGERIARLGVWPLVATGLLTFAAALLASLLVAPWTSFKPHQSHIPVDPAPAIQTEPYSNPYAEQTEGAPIQ